MGSSCCSSSHVVPLNTDTMSTTPNTSHGRTQDSSGESLTNESGIGRTTDNDVTTETANGAHNIHHVTVSSADNIDDFADGVLYAPGTSATDDETAGSLSLFAANPLTSREIFVNSFNVNDSTALDVDDAQSIDSRGDLDSSRAGRLGIIRQVSDQLRDIRVLALGPVVAWDHNESAPIKRRFSPLDSWSNTSLASSNFSSSTWSISDLDGDLDLGSSKTSHNGTQRPKAAVGKRTSPRKSIGNLRTHGTITS